MKHPALALLAVLPVTFWAPSGCYLAHDRAGFDAARPDGALPDVPARVDAGVDVGPPRPLRWVPLAAEPGALRPPARGYHFAVLDAARDRMIILGGIDSYCCGSPGYRQDVWALDLTRGTWEELGALDRPLMGTSPVEAALDVPRNRIVIVSAVNDFGGAPHVAVAVDLTTLAITALPAVPWPAPAIAVRATHDAASSRVVVNDAYFLDRTEGVWIFDLATDTWATVAVEGSPGQLFHAPLTMVGRDRAVLYSGYTGDVGSASIWELDLSTRRFRQLDVAAEMGGRFSHRAIFEPARGTLVVFGGNLFTLDRGTLLFDVATSSLTEPALTPAAPPRRDFTMVFDAARRRAIAFGGAYQSERALDDTWALELP